MKPLSTRQREVLVLICAGLTDKGVAKRLAIEPCTVEEHCRQILIRTGTKRRIQAAVWACKAGLV